MSQLLVKLVMHGTRYVAYEQLWLLLYVKVTIDASCSGTFHEYTAMSLLGGLPAKETRRERAGEEGCRRHPRSTSDP